MIRKTSAVRETRKAVSYGHLVVVGRTSPKSYLRTPTRIMAKRGRKRDETIAQAEEALGLEPPTGHRTVAERHARVEKVKEEKKALAVANNIAGDIDLLTEDDSSDPFYGLTERQKSIAKMTLRGLSQTAMGQVLGIDQSMVSRELKKVHEHLKAKGTSLNQAAVVGRSLSVYEEVQHKAWELFATTSDIGHKNKALNTVMLAQEKQIKLLMDLGLVKRAAQDVNHKLDASDFVKRWQSGQVQTATKAFLEAQLTPLEDPTPPDDVVDADYEETTKQLNEETTDNDDSDDDD